MAELDQQIVAAELAVYRSAEQLRRRTKQLGIAVRARAKVLAIGAAGVALLGWLIYPRRPALGRTLGRVGQSQLARMLPIVAPVVAPFVTPWLRRKAGRGPGGTLMGMLIAVLPMLFKVRAAPPR